MFIIVGLILALAAGAGVFFIGSLLGGGGGGLGSSANITVVIAKQAIPLRHSITADDLDTQLVSGAFAKINTFSNKSDLVNLIAEIQITKGSVITSDMLARDIGQVPAGSAPAYLPLASGYVAMAIPTGEQQGVAGHITLGDYITVIASATVTVFSPGAVQSGPPKVVSKTVFTNVRVIGLGPATANVQPAAGGGASVGSAQGASGGVTSSLTIEVTQCDAEYLTWFLGNTTIKYTVESFQDYLKTPPSVPDPTCPKVRAAQGVSQTQVNHRYHFTSL